MQLTELEGRNAKTAEVSQALSLLWRELAQVSDLEAVPKT